LNDHNDLLNGVVHFENWQIEERSRYWLGEVFMKFLVTIDGSRAFNSGCNEFYKDLGFEFYEDTDVYDYPDGKTRWWLKGNNYSEAMINLESAQELIDFLLKYHGSLDNLHDDVPEIRL